MKVDFQLIYLSFGLILVVSLWAKFSSLGEEILEEYCYWRFFLFKYKFIYDLLNHLEADGSSTTTT